MRLEAAPLALAPALELRAEEFLPESSRPVQVIRRELDQGDHEQRVRLVGFEPEEFKWSTEARLL
jgi:hypothetical protein